MGEDGSLSRPKRSCCEFNHQAPKRQSTLSCTTSGVLGTGSLEGVRLPNFLFCAKEMSMRPTLARPKRNVKRKQLNSMDYGRSAVYAWANPQPFRSGSEPHLPQEEAW